LRNLFPPEYEAQGKLHILPVRGEMNGYSQIVLQENPLILADIAHKQWSGKIYSAKGASKQAILALSQAIITFSGDNHHPAIVVEGGKVIVKGFGESPVYAYVRHIGKPSSRRGILIAYIRRDLRPVYFFAIVDDSVINPFLAWDYYASQIGKIKKELYPQDTDRSGPGLFYEIGMASLRA